ncbi:dolichyl-diphosphooligosaccharide--protein glycosyltransferase subunit 1 [Coemansia sp. RSA 2610]|nr:dolichyl-diphosphooligosaccharide--protein glycosyltransferase subunit 1 [Coemansia sp. RSA 2610]
MRTIWRAVVALLLLALVADAANSGLVNTNVIRTVDLKTLPSVKEQIGVVVQNDHHSKVFKTYTVQIAQNKAPYLADVSVRERKSGVELVVTKLNGTDNDGLLSYRATLARPLQPGEKISLNVDCVFLAMVEPRPRAVVPTDDQTWLWTDSALVPSAYPTRKQKTVVRTSGDIRAHAPTGDSTRDNAKSVTFGPFTADAPSEPLEVRFRDNSEQLEALVHRREYFVSHWANDLNVQEYYELRNRAPAIAGGFDKVKQTMAKFTRARDNYVKTLLVKVPADARQLYVVDEIGNVSTSAVTRRQRVDNEVFRVMQLRPRFPLAGQWNYTWWHGYSVPLTGYLRATKGRYALRVPFIGALVGSASQNDEIPLSALATPNTAVRAYQLRVTLPEGATNVHAHVPVAVDDVSQHHTAYYFDSRGRTVVVIEQANVAPSTINAQLLVTYDYSALALWQKPLVVALALFAVFALASAVGRMQLGLAAAPKPRRSQGRSKESSS